MSEDCLDWSFVPSCGIGLGDRVIAAGWAMQLWWSGQRLCDFFGTTCHVSINRAQGRTQFCTWVENTWAVSSTVRWCQHMFCCLPLSFSWSLDVAPGLCIWDQDSHKIVGSQRSGLWRHNSDSVPPLYHDAYIMVYILFGVIGVWTFSLAAIWEYQACRPPDRWLFWSDFVMEKKLACWCLPLHSLW